MFNDYHYGVITGQMYIYKNLTIFINNNDCINYYVLKICEITNSENINKEEHLKILQELRNAELIRYY